MVSKPPKRRSLKSFPFVLVIALGIIISAGVYGVLTYILPEEKDDSDEVEVVATETEVKKDTVSKIPKFIDLQSVVDSWAISLPPGVSFGLEIYDLNNKKIAAEKNSEETFLTASLYKMFIVYEGYKEVETGELTGNEYLVSGKNVSECLDLAIRESDSPCAETLAKKIGPEKIEDLIKEEYKLENSSFSGYYSTAEDFIKLLKIYYYHEDLSEESFEKLKDSMLNQPKIVSDLCDGYCDFRMGLPSGFSDAVKVYNKVGWNSDGSKWATYNDAAILEFADLGRTYLIAVFTENLPFTGNNIKSLNSLASALEEAIVNQK